MRLSLTSSLKSMAILTACSFVLRGDLPNGWRLAGSAPGNYDCGIDSMAAYNGEQSSYLKAKDGASLPGFGTLMSTFSPGPYLSTRVRFSANVQAESVTNWAGLWMRVDGANQSVLAFDNMQSRPIKGTVGWQSFSVVLDVPDGATGISLGILLAGGGAVWLNGAKLEVVGPDVPTTGMLRNSIQATGSSRSSKKTDGPASLNSDK